MYTETYLDKYGPVRLFVFYSDPQENPLEGRR
jgi:hypothetical protein